jgi:ribosomal-protein-alanine N-acetyltransferase
MTYRFQKMNKKDATETATWRYTDQYAIYNPDEGKQEEYVAWLLEPRYAYHSVYEGDVLVGLCCFGEDAQVSGGDYSLQDTLDIGFGMRPDLTGQGRGTAFLAAILSFANSHYNVTHFRTTIATFNLRSQRVFEKAGFTRVQKFVSHSDSPLEFVVMVREAAQVEESTAQLIF